MKYILGFLLFGAIVISACTKDTVPEKIVDPIAVDPCLDTVSYSTTIVPLLNDNCVPCHNSSSASGGYDLSSYANVSASADVVLHTIKQDDPANFAPMPQGGDKLPDPSIQDFECWINQGKLNN